VVGGREGLFAYDPSPATHGARRPGTGIRIVVFLLAVGSAGLLFVAGFPPAAPDRLPVLLVALALALAAAWNPGAALAAFAFLFPCAGLLARLAGGTDPIAWPALLFGGLAAGWSFRFIYDFESSPDPSALDAPLSSLLFVWVAATGLAIVRASTLWAVLRGLTGRAVNGQGMEDAAAIRESLFALSSLAAGALFYFIVRRSARAVREKTLRAALLGVAAAAAAASLERAGLLPPETSPFWRMTRRISGGAADPNSLGLLCALVLVVLLARIARGKAGRSGPLTAALLAAGLLLSGSRTGLALLVLGVVILLASGGLGAPVRRIALAAAGALLLAGAVLLLRGSAGTLGARLSQSFDPNLPMEYRVSARPTLWRAAWRLFLRHPVEGAGMGVFSRNFQDLMREENRRFAMRDNPGSGYVQALAETGAAGLFLTVLFAFRLGVQALRRSREADSLPAGAGVAVLAFLAALTVGSHWLAADVSLLFFLMAAVAAGSAPAGVRGTWRTARLAAVFLFVAASAMAVLATARPEETFRWSSRIGFHGEEAGPGGPFRWTRRRFALWLEPGQTRRLILAHFSPSPDPVTLTAKAGARPALARTLKAGESVSLTLQGSPDRPRAIVFEVSRAFVPKRLGLSQDRRELGLLSIEPR